MLSLTTLSAFLCFNRLNFPSMMIDECFTYWRVCGNLDQLLDTLRNDAFMPLHYEELNWIHQGFPLGFGLRIIPAGIPLTPTTMRFFPAMCGTAMTPVMYFFGRQIFSKRAALIAAAFITCSAYELFFARNAKMYMPAWMFSTLAIACFIWWLRTWRREAWLCWIFAGIAAAGFHAITLLLLPLAPLYFITTNRYAGWRVPMLILGLLMILLAPAIYYGVCNRWTQNSGGIVPGVMGEPNADANWQASGLNWIEPAENSIELPRTALNCYLSGLEWSGLDDLASPAPLLRKYSWLMIAAASTTYGVLILGTLPWPRKIPTDQPQPAWRSLSWIMLWLGFPTYCFFYCRSVQHFDSPVDWLKTVVLPIRWYFPLVLLGAATLTATLNYFPKSAKFIAIPCLLLIISAVIQTARYRLEWMAILDRADASAIAWIVAPAVLFHYSGDTFRQRFRRTLQLLAVIVSMLLLCEIAAVLWRWLHTVSVRKHPELPWQSIWHIRYVAVAMPAVWLAAAALIARLPNQYFRIAAVLVICSYNLANTLSREYMQTEVPLDRAMADMFLSQPSSDVRTYFDMHAMTDNVYYRPMAAYNACIAAGMKTTPAEFRTGYTWPFVFGSAAADFKNRCIYNSTVSSSKLRQDMSANPQLKRVIVWETESRFFGASNSDYVGNALGKHWKLVSDEQIISHWYFTWANQWTIHRFEYRRDQ